MMACAAQSLDRLTERARHYSVAGVILTAAVHERFVPPFMVAAFLLAAVHMARHWRDIPLRQYWPMALLPLFYVLSLANIPGPAWEMSGEVAPMLRVGYLLAPIALIDLRPTRLWGSVQIVGGLAVVLLGLLLAVYHSLSIVDGQWVWQTLHGVSPEEAAGNPLHFFFSGYTYFYYSGFTYQMGLHPSFVSFTLLLALVVSIHRLLTLPGRRARYGFATLFLLVGFILTGSRTMAVAALLCLLLFVAYLTVRRRVPWYGIAVCALLVGGAGYAAMQLPRMKRVYVALTNENAVRDLMRHEQRLMIWHEIYQHREEFLPWGMGTSRSRPSVSAWMAPHCAPDDVPTKTHNELVEALVEQGWPGLALMAGILLLPLLFARRFRAVELMLLVPLYVLLSFESMSSIAVGVASLAFTYCVVWSLSIHRRRGLSDGCKPYL